MLHARPAPRLTLYTTMACPYAHRAMLAIELRPIPGVKRELITTTNQFTTINKQGLPRGDALEMFAEASVEGLQQKKEAYKRDVNPSGEVPSLLLPTCDVVSESEIVCEYIDAVSERDSPRLMPSDPLAAARVRLAMKRFNSCPSAIVALLKNQDEARDEALTAQLDAALAGFVATIDASGGEPESGFCFGRDCTLADVHAAPFVFRFEPVLRHYRGYNMIERVPRLGLLLRAMAALPEWERCLRPPDGSYPAVTTERLLALYAAYANDGRWAEGPEGPVLAGRGAKQ